MIVIGRNHCTPAGDLVSHRLGGHGFTLGDERHLCGDLPGLCPLQLGAAVADHSRPGWQPNGKVNNCRGVGVGPRGVVQVEVFAIGQVDPTRRHSPPSGNSR